MKTSSLEITDNEYLIKLPKTDFDLSFISQLIKRIQAEQIFFNYKDDNNEEDIRSRKIESEASLRYDNLNDK